MDLNGEWFQPTYGDDLLSYYLPQFPVFSSWAYLMQQCCFEIRFWPHQCWYCWLLQGSAFSFLPCARTWANNVPYETFPIWYSSFLIGIYNYLIICLFSLLQLSGWCSSNYEDVDLLHSCWQKSALTDV